MNDNTNNQWKSAMLAKGKYNWDSFADLLLGCTPNEIENDLLYLYFLITDYCARDNAPLNTPEQLCRALYTLRELYQTFKELGKADEGTLKLVHEQNNNANLNE